MAAGGTERMLDAGEFQRLPEEPGYRLELVRGRVVRSPGPGPRHGDIVTNVVLIVGPFVRQHRLGALLAGGTAYILARGPDTVRGPDVSFIARERLPKGRLPDSYLEGGPELAIEIVSPSNRPGQLRERMMDLFGGGCREVWALDPARERMTVHRSDGTNAIFGADSELTSDQLPGFRCHVRDFFRSE